VIKTAIVVINHKIQTLFIESLSNHFLTIVKLHFKSKSFYGFSIYCSPFESLETELIQVKGIFDILKPKNLIISIDSNAKSKVWFNNKDNSRGQSIIDFINQNNLFILNDNNCQRLTTYYTTRGMSNIDLTITDLNSFQLIKNWKIVDTFDSMSDHKYIEFSIREEFQKIKYKNTRKYIIKSEKWTEFLNRSKDLINIMEPIIENVNNEIELNCFINYFSDKLTNICDNIFIIKNYDKTISKKSNHWWTENLTKKRKEVNRIRRAYQRCQTSNRLLLEYNYLKVREEYKQLINSSKTKSWQLFIENNSRDNPWGIVYVISKEKIKVEKVSELKQSDGSIITNTGEIADKLLETLFPDDNTENDTEFHKQLRQNLYQEYNQENDLTFSETEVTEIINSQNDNKAPGLDGFTANIIKKFHSLDNQFLTRVYNKCLLIGTFPEKWKISVVKILKKPNKADYTSPKSYRPISLLSVFAKVLEKLLINRINYYLGSKSLLNSKQYGFRPQKSTIDALINVKNFIEEGFKNKGFTLLIALDISGAFDNAFWPMILNNLRDFRIPGNLYYLSKSYFMDRKAKLWFQNLEIEKNLTKGCPQGSACGPGFWSIIYNSLLELDLPDNSIIQGFADDTLVMVSGQSISEIQSKANIILNSVKEWSLENKLEFNASKTVSVLFTKNIKYLKPKIYLNSN
jgi:hypothetical protein